MAGWPRCSRGWPHSPTVGQHSQRCGKPVIWGFGRTDQDVALYTANSSKNPEITTAGPADDDSSDEDDSQEDDSQEDGSHEDDSDKNSSEKDGSNEDSSNEDGSNEDGSNKDSIDGVRIKLGLYKRGPAEMKGL